MKQHVMSPEEVQRWNEYQNDLRRYRKDKRELTSVLFVLMALSVLLWWLSYFAVNTTTMVGRFNTWLDAVSVVTFLGAVASTFGLCVTAVINAAHVPPVKDDDLRD